ncbi:MAG TPA: peptidylprolyl isomerase [Pyrinomonadaceae bacterium]|jgi:parvulin-like peptidyl-prolyl isomerase
MRDQDINVIIWRTLALVLICLALISCQKSTPSQTGNSTDGGLPPVVATVNGRPIQTRLYEMYLKNGREALGLELDKEEGRRKYEQLKEGIVEELIDRMLISQEAERRGLQITPERMAEAERRAIAQFGGDKKYDEYLSAHRLTRDEYGETLKAEIYGELMRAELSKGITASDEDVKAYYDAHLKDQDMQQPERVTASHILVAARPNLIRQELERDKNLSGDALAKAVREEMERRRQRAEELRRQATGGADFSTLARNSSDDPSSRERGGDLGTFTRDSHPRAFDDAAFALKPGTVSAVVQTDFGYHVIKVSSHEQARAMTLEEAAPQIRQRLVAQREAARLTEWLSEIRRKATVRINEPFRFGKLRDEFPPM